MGEDDPVVGTAGARHLLRRLQQGGFPARNIRLDFVSSQPGFVADHCAPLRTSAAAKAAFWRAADDLLDELNQK